MRPELLKPDFSGALAFRSSFPDDAQRDQGHVFSNLERAFEAALWHLKRRE